MVTFDDLVYLDEKGKRIYPQIYAYSDINYPEWVKVGYTTRKDVEDRIKEQYNTLLQLVDEPYVLLFKTEAVRNNGVSFTDREVHDLLKHRNVIKKGEFYKGDPYELSKAILDIKNSKSTNGIFPVLKEDYDRKVIIPKLNSSKFRVVKPM